MATMTIQQASELQQAILRAQRDGILILARGTRTSDGARVWGVTRSSSHPSYKLHQVVLVGGRLLCDCPSRVICKHRAVVHEALVTERLDSREREVEQALHEAARALNITLGLAPPPPPARARTTGLRDDTAAVSPWR